MQQHRPRTYRHDANLALAGLDDAGAVGANQPRFALVLQNLLHLHHVVLGDALCDAHHLRSYAHVLLTHASSEEPQLCLWSHLDCHADQLVASVLHTLY